MRIERTKFEGLKELSEALNKLTEPNFRGRAMKRAGAVAMKQILADAIMNAPMLSEENIKKNPNISAGTLKSDISFRSRFHKQPLFYKTGKRAGKIRNLSQYEYIGQVKTGKASQDYAVPIEYGRTEYIVMRIHAFGRQTDPYEAKMAAQKPNPFMRKALDANSDSAIRIFMIELSKQVLNLAKQQSAKIKKRNK